MRWGTEKQGSWEWCESGKLKVGTRGKWNGRIWESEEVRIGGNGNGGNWECEWGK